MNREFLKGLGLEDDAIEKIMAEHGKTVNAVKKEIETITTERDDLKQQLSDRDTQLDELSKQVKDNEELTAEINRLKEQNEEATKELQAKLEKQAFEFSLEKALTNAKAKNPKAVKALLDLENIKLDGDKLLGLDDQLEKLKESDSYLFEEENNNAPHIVAGGNPKGSSYMGKNPFTKEHWNLTEQGKLFKENPELYNHLKAQAGK
jgi:chromosome segregation ATPase